MKDLQQVSDAEKFGIEGVIVGKAIYEHRIDIQKAITKFQNGN